MQCTDAESRLECVDKELRGPLAQRCGELYSFNVEQRTQDECQYVVHFCFLIEMEGRGGEGEGREHKRERERQPLLHSVR